MKQDDGTIYVDPGLIARAAEEDDGYSMVIIEGTGLEYPALTLGAEGRLMVDGWACDPDAGCWQRGKQVFSVELVREFVHLYGIVGFYRIADACAAGKDTWTNEEAAAVAKGESL